MQIKRTDKADRAKFRLRDLFLMAVLGFSFLTGNAAIARQDMPEARECTATQMIGTGKASWYGPGFHGRKTANGEIFNMNAMTAAHKTLPLGTRIQVENEQTGETLIVRINDRGPYIKGRVLDLSKHAATRLGLEKQGVGQVVIRRCL